MFTIQKTDTRFYEKLVNENTLINIMGKRINTKLIDETTAEFSKVYGPNRTQIDESYARKLALVDHYGSVFEDIETKLMETYDGVLPQGLFEQVENSERVITDMRRSATTHMAKHEGTMVENDKGVMEESALVNSAMVGFRSLIMGSIAYLYVGTWAATAGAAAIPAGLFAAWALLLPDNTNRRWRNKLKKFAGDSSKVLSFMMVLPVISEKKNLELLLNDITLHRDVESKFKRNYDIKEALESLTSFCNKKSEIEAPKNMKLNIRSTSRMRKFINQLRGMFDDEVNMPEIIAEYRECIMTRMVSLYQVLFLGIFVQYIEYDSAKKVITGSYETKLMFSQFKQLGKQDKKFQKQFEVLIQLRNMINDYVEILEETHRPKFDKNDEVAQKVEKMLTDADKDIEKAIRNNIDKLEIDNAKQAFDAQIADLDVLAVHKDPYGKMKTVDDEKDEKIEDKKSTDGASNKYGYNLV